MTQMLGPSEREFKKLLEVSADNFQAAKLGCFYEILLSIKLEKQTKASFTQ